MDKYIWSGGSAIEVNEWNITKENPTCELDRIGQQYNADKANVQWMSRGPPGNGNVPHGWSDNLILPIAGHNYLEIYSQYFEKHRAKPLRILEIGMGVYPWNGYSMRMWLDYFPNCELHIIDNTIRNFDCRFDFDRERVKFHLHDQGKNESLQEFVSKFKECTFDFIIDDGSHIASHQYETLKAFFPLLKIDGIYFIEDIHDEKFLEYIQKIFYSINYGNVSGSFNASNEIPNISSVNIYRSLIAISKGKQITR